MASNKDSRYHNGTHHNHQVENGISIITNGIFEKVPATPAKKPRVSFSNGTGPQNSSRSNDVKAFPRPSLIEMYTSQRWGLTFIALVVITLNLTLRLGLSMALVCMVKPEIKNETLSNQSELMLQSDYDETISEIIVVSMTTYKDASASKLLIDKMRIHIRYMYIKKWVVYWDSSTQGQVLSSYFYGFPVFCVFGGYAAGKYGAKNLIMFMVTTVAVASLCIPYAAITSPYIVIGLRIFIGLASGGITPAINQLLSKWTPLYEKSRIIATANAGQILGNVVTFFASGLLCTVPVQNGWPLIFYVFGTLNLFAMIVWWKYVYEHPDDHPTMTKHEVNYIKRGRRDSENVKMPDPPWIKIITSPAFLAILSAHISFGFTFTTLGTFLPLYMNDILKFEPALNGVVSSVPFIGRLIGTMISGYIGDKLYISGRLSTGLIRKMFQSIGMILSAPFLIWLSYLDSDNRALAVVLFIVYWFLQGACTSGFRANHLDIAPRFAGVLNGMTQTFGSLAALVSPLVTTAIIKERIREEWQIIFFICAGVGIAGTLVFDCFAKGDIQPWAQDEDDISVSNDDNGTEIELPAITISSHVDEPPFSNDNENEIQRKHSTGILKLTRPRSYPLFDKIPQILTETLNQQQLSFIEQDNSNKIAQNSNLLKPSEKELHGNRFQSEFLTDDSKNKELNENDEFSEWHTNVVNDVIGKCNSSLDNVSLGFDSTECKEGKISDQSTKGSETDGEEDSEKSMKNPKLLKLFIPDRHHIETTRL